MVLANLWVLWVLVPLWAAIGATWAWLTYTDSRGQARRTPTLAYPSTAAVLRLGSSWRLRLRRVVQALRLASLALLVVAMARPQTVLGIRPATTLGVDIMLVVDTSGSMRALDLDNDKPIASRRTRLQVVKDVVAQFIAKRAQDQVGLVVFGAEAFMQCPLTLDHGLLTSLLGRLQNGMAGDATAIGSGIGAAVSRLKKSTAKSKIIVLLTDGINNTGPLSPKVAAEVARAFDIKIYTIGVGGRGQAPFLVDRPFFGQAVVYDEVGLDEDALREVAQLTAGEYFRAEDTKSLARIYDDIDRLEKSEVKSPAIVDYAERAGRFVGPAIALLLLEIVVLGTRLRSLP